MASSTEPLHIRESQPFGHQTEDPASGFKEKMLDPLTQRLQAFPDEQTFARETLSTKQTLTSETVPNEAISSQETFSMHQARLVPEAPAQLMPPDQMLTGQLPSQQATSHPTSRSVAPASPDSTSESLSLIHI